MSVLDRSEGARTRWSSQGEGVLFAMGLANPGDRWCRVDPVLALPCDDAVTTPHRWTEQDGAVRLPPVSASRDHLAQPMGDSSRLVLPDDADQLPLTDPCEHARDLPRTWLARHRDRSGA